MTKRFPWKSVVAAFALAPGSAVLAQETGTDLAMSFRLLQWSDRGGDSVVMMGHSVSSGDKARIDMTATVGRAQTPFLTDGPLSTIMSDMGKTFTYLDAKNRRYMQLRPMELLSRGLPGTKIEYSTPEVTVSRIGAGPVILGHPTLHYRITVRMTMTIAGMGEQESANNTSVNDYYYAIDMKSSFDPLASITGNDIQVMFASSNQRVNEKLKAAGDTLPKSPPLRISTTNTVFLGGRTRVSRMETEVTSVEWVKADPKIFEIPAGYSAVGLPGMESPPPKP